MNKNKRTIFSSIRILAVAILVGQTFFSSLIFGGLAEMTEKLSSVSDSLVTSLELAMDDPFGIQAFQEDLAIRRQEAANLAYACNPAAE